MRTICNVCFMLTGKERDAVVSIEKDGRPIDLCERHKHWYSHPVFGTKVIAWL